MKRLLKISLLLGGLLLTACSSPKIQIVDNAPQNYKKVAKTEIEISTRTWRRFEPTVRRSRY